MSHFMMTIFILPLAALLAPVKGAPTPSLMSRQTNVTSTPANFQLQNALDAQQLNMNFSGLKAGDSCTGLYLFHRASAAC